MKHSGVFPFLAGLFILLSCSHRPVLSTSSAREIASLSEIEKIEGLWKVQGAHSSRGPYQGELELRQSKNKTQNQTQDKTLDVVRVITYLHHSFEGYQVQEVWTGKAVLDQNSLLISYTLKRADYISRLGSLRRLPSDFKTPLHILAHFKSTPQGLETQFPGLPGTEYQENLINRRDLGPQPLWQDHRTQFDAKGPKMPFVVKAAMEALKMKIGYEKDPWVRSFRHRAEYKNQVPSLIFDPTDYDFYQKNKNILRLTNKTTDKISLTETLVRRHAYAPSLEEKTQGYEKELRERHIDAFGMYVSVVLDEKGQILREVPEGDSTLWTGMYVGSQALRYLVTKDPEALENVRKSLKALFLLMDLPRDPQEFARTLTRHDPQQRLSKKWRRGTGAYASLDWMAGGNNDMFKGIAHAFLWATQVIPPTDTEIWKELEEKSRRLLQLKVVKEKPQNRPVALGLAALILKDKNLREKYLQSYKNLRVRLAGYDFNTEFYWQGNADWSGIHLGMVGDITQILLADQLEALEIRDHLRQHMLETWVVYKPARRHLLTLATHTFSYRHGARSQHFLKNSSEAEFESHLKHSLWGLREIPYPRPTFLDVEVDHSLKPEWSLSPIPRLFWKAAKNPPPPVEYFYQGLYDYPFFERDAFDSTYLWKSAAFNYRVSHTSGVAYGGVDYLYAYWLCRYGGILP